MASPRFYNCIPERLLNLPPSSHTVYTDGSWKQHFPDPLSEILFPDTVTTLGGGSVVLLGEHDWFLHPVHIIQLTNPSELPIFHSQTSELLALLTGIQLSGYPLFLSHFF